MPLPSLYISGEARERLERCARARGYGAAIGAFAACSRPSARSTTLAPSAPARRQILSANAPQIAGAALAFALLCAGAAALRNLIARRLIWPEQDSWCAGRLMAPSRGFIRYRAISTFLVSGKNNNPITKLMVAIAIGYHRAE